MTRMEHIVAIEDFRKLCIEYGEARVFLAVSGGEDDLIHDAAARDHNKLCRERANRLWDEVKAAERALGLR